MHFKNVLSCFDGISCGQLALVRVGHTYDNYYASEVDKYAIKIALKNFPNTIQLGDVKTVWSRNLPQIDLLIGGSPCQDLSSAGKRAGLTGERSGLFWHFVRLLRTCKPRYFLLENVASMSKESRDIISEALGVEPILINSALVSAQQRKRLYWTNISGIIQPQNKGIFWKDIKENGAADNFYYSEKGLIWLKKHSEKTGKKLKIFGDFDKCNMIEASHYKNYSNERFFGIKDVKGLRYITPLECERAQTLPDKYTEGVSNTQRYKMIGNGWTVDVIAHIFSFIRED